MCLDHFVSGKPCIFYDTTNPDWTPSLNLGHNAIRPSDISRHERASVRAAKRRKVFEEEEIGEVIEEERLEVEAVQSDGNSDQLEQELQKTEEELGTMRTELEKNQ